MDTLISAKITSKTIETHFKYVTAHLISPKNSSKGYGSFTSEKHKTLI